MSIDSKYRKQKACGTGLCCAFSGWMKIVPSSCGFSTVPRTCPGASCTRIQYLSTYFFGYQPVPGLGTFHETTFRWPRLLTATRCRTETMRACIVNAAKRIPKTPCNKNRTSFGYVYKIRWAEGTIGNRLWFAMYKHLIKYLDMKEIASQSELNIFASPCFLL